MPLLVLLLLLLILVFLAVGFAIAKLFLIGVAVVGVLFGVSLLVYALRRA